MEKTTKWGAISNKIDKINSEQDELEFYKEVIFAI